MSPDRTECDSEGCSCALEGDQPRVTRDDKQYCSERCAEQRGCDHSECNCGQYPGGSPMP